MQQRERQRDLKHRSLSLNPSPRLRHGSPDVGSSPGRAGIAGEVIVFKGTSDPALGYAIGKSGDTESDIGGGGSVLVPG
jgi:hypothetical protein